MVLAERLPGVRQLPGLLTRGQPDVVLFESWRGRYADSPRALSEALHDARPDLTQLWVVDAADRTALPPWAVPVAPGTRAYLRALGSAGHVVANTHMPRYFRKRGATRYVQTWHGTPLKRIGLDIPAPGLTPEYRALLRADVARWDVLLSPNPFSTAVFRDAFGYRGEILETGYPRNDLLASAAAPAARAAARAALGLDENTRAVLYAPTWRDSATFDLGMDLDRFSARLGEGTVLLLRLHPIVRARVRPPAGRGVLDVSSHPDIRELFLAADVLVTDYSSVMFDFAVTRRPMVFFTYDLAAYRDELRGFYFDFEREAPGPLVATTDELCDALESLEEVAGAHEAAYNRFLARFCPMDDGGAAQRVIAALFSE